MKTTATSGMTSTNSAAPGAPIGYACAVFTGRAARDIRIHRNIHRISLLIGLIVLLLIVAM